jgi:hypothetical protein
MVRSLVEEEDTAGDEEGDDGAEDGNIPAA